MKKIFLLFLPLLFIFACSTEHKIEESTETGEEQATRKLLDAKQKFSRLEQKMSLKEDTYSSIIKTLDTYFLLFIDKENYESSHWRNDALLLRMTWREEWGNEMYYMNEYYPEYMNKVANYIFQPFVEPDIQINCFVHSNTFLNKEDECILMRRNARKSLVGYYNYKKYLPNSSKISTDEKFLELVEAYRNIFKHSKKRNNETGIYEDKMICDEWKEKTTTEIAQCKEDAKKYIIQIVEGTVPHCRNKVNKEYKEFLQNNVKQLSTLNNVTQQNFNERIFISSTERNLGKAFYHGAFNRALYERMKNFGYVYFCRVDGFEQDIKK